MKKTRYKRRAISASITEVILVIVAVAISIAAASYILQKVNLFHEEQIRQPIAINIMSIYREDGGLKLTIMAKNVGYKPYTISEIVVDGGTFILKKSLNVQVNPNEEKYITIDPEDWDTIQGTIPNRSVFVTIKIRIDELGVQTFNQRIQG